MAEIDPVILQLRADLARYKNELRTTTTLVQNSLDRQERSVVELESQFKRSSGNIANAARGIGGALAGAFSLQQAQQFIDAYTRIQNQLRVAGLEGEDLARVQERLLAIGNQYGVSLETLSGLFGNASQAGRELGASQSQILTLTTATAQALQITGTGAEQASGAILGLSQALASGKVQAEEFNQINEGGLRPLLQAAANTERFGGSVAKLRKAVVDGTVTSKEFFDLIQRGAPALEQQAAKAALTLSGAFTKLNNQLTVFVGQAAQTNGVTTAVAAGIDALANNLDTVADALAVIAAVLLGRFVAGLTAASVSSGVLGTAIFAVQARALGAATSLEAMAFAGRAAGASMLAAFGGPVGIAVTALAVGIAYLATRTDTAATAADANAEAQKRAAAVTQKAADAADKLAGAHGKARKEALALARAEAENVKQKVASAKASAALALAEAARERNRANAIARQTSDEASMVDMSLRGGGQVSSRAGATEPAVRAAESRAKLAEGRARQANADASALQKQLDSILSKISAAEVPVSNVADPEKKTKKSRERTGPTPAEIEDRFTSDLRRLRADQLQDELQITTDAQRRREISAELDDIEYAERRAQIDNEREYTAAQKAKLRAALDRQFGRTTGEGDDITVNASNRDRARAREVEETMRRLRENQLSIEREALEAEARNATTRAQRLALERRILALQQEEERSRLEASIAAGEIADAAKARFDLERAQAADRAGVERAGEGPLARYRRGIEDIDTALEQVQVDALQRLNDELTDGITNALGLKGALGDIASQLIQIGIQRTLIGPLADALFGPASGGGGIIGSALSGLFGRASGGYVAPGQTVRVNEQRGGMELLRMGSQGGTVIPLGQTRAVRAPSQIIVQQTVSVDARNSVNPDGFERRILSLSQRQAQEAGAKAYDRSIRDAPAAVTRARRFGTSG